MYCCSDVCSEHKRLGEGSWRKATYVIKCDKSLVKNAKTKKKMTKEIFLNTVLVYMHVVDSYHVHGLHPYCKDG